MNDRTRPRSGYLAWPRNRRRVMAGAAVLLLSGVVAVPVVALTSSSTGKPRSALVFTDAPSTTVQAAPDPTTSTTQAPATTTTAPPATTKAVAAAARPAPTATTTLVCHNSYNPACGPFRWDSPPAPAGSPSVTIVPRPSNPTVGQEVTFTVTVSDPNTAVYTCGQVTYGDGMGQGCSATTAGPACETRYGPWDPPSRITDSATTTYTYSYERVGVYTVKATFPVGNPCYDPYQGSVSGSVQVTVGAAPTTTTTSP